MGWKRWRKKARISAQIYFRVMTYVYPMWPVVRQKLKDNPDEDIQAMTREIEELWRLAEKMR